MIEEIAGTAPIEAVSTSTAGFMGPTERGPLGAQLVTSLAEFLRLYGDGGATGAASVSFLPYAVAGFFENGGRRAFVARVVGDGADGSVGVADYLGVVDPEPTGLAALREIAEVSMICVPDEVNGAILSTTDRADLRAAVVAQCEQRHDRIALLQVAGGEGNVELVERPLVSSFAAMYYPWLRVPDARTGGTRLVPPGGHVAGALAANDRDHGVQASAADLVLRGVAVGALSGELEPLEFPVDGRVSDLLTAKGINAIRDLRVEGRGIRVWGAHTLADDREWKYVHVRRSLLFIEQSIDRATQWVVFEPNRWPTWLRVQQSVYEFLDGQWRSGVLKGATPAEAFFVRCGPSTMTESDIVGGRLVCVIGVAPVKPAEFVMFRIGHTTADTDP